MTLDVGVALTFPFLQKRIPSFHKAFINPLKLYCIDYFLHFLERQQLLTRYYLI